MLSVRDNRQLRAVAQGLKLLPRTLSNDVNRTTARELGPVWKQLVSAHATTRMDTRVLVPGARVKGGNPPVLMAAQSRRGIGRTRRLVPRDDWAAFEFGAVQGAKVTYQRLSPKGKTHQVTRDTRAQLPPRNRAGRVVFPAIAEFVPRAVSMWTQTFMRKVYEAVEAKGA